MTIARMQVETGQPDGKDPDDPYLVPVPAVIAAAAAPGSTDPRR